MSSETRIAAISRLHQLIEYARSADVSEANAASLATTDAASGRPSVRTIYVHVETDEITFFVNSASGKGRQLQWNTAASLCFFWRELSRQVILDGGVEQLDDERADTLWQHRTRESALVARSSKQHEREGDPAGLAERHREQKQRYNFARVERPEHWIGYRLHPERIEFWETGWGRMRMRYSYERQLGGRWQVLTHEP